MAIFGESLPPSTNPACSIGGSSNAIAQTAHLLWRSLRSVGSKAFGLPATDTPAGVRAGDGRRLRLVPKCRIEAGNSNIHHRVDNR